MTEIPKDDLIIQIESKPVCILCGQPGNILYGDLHDRLFAAPGTWTLKKCLNIDCGLMWLDPAPCKDELWKAYTTYFTHQDKHIIPAGVMKRAYHFVRDCYLSLEYGYFAGLNQSRLKWLGLIIYFFPGRRADVDFSVMYLPAKLGGRLLEIGCGSGSMLNFMSSLGWQAEGIDFDPSAVSNAKSKGLEVALGSLEEQNYKDNIFDAIILSHVIEHIPDPHALISECFRVLKPGGLISLVTPNTESIGSRFFGRSWLHLDPPRHLIIFNSKVLHNLVQKAGFNDIKTRTVVRDAHTLFWASFSINWCGKFKMGSQPVVYLKLIMLLLRFVEWGFIQLFPNRGEEILLIGIK